MLIPAALLCGGVEFARAQHASLTGAELVSRPGSVIAVRGLDLEAIYTTDLFANLQGGRGRDASYLHNIDLTVGFDLERLVGWKGAHLFVYGLGNHGGNPSTHVGDAQGVSNIEAPDAWRLYELWFEQDLLGRRASVLFGLYDLNTEFDVLQSAALFLHSSFGIGASFGLSGVSGPSIFPITSTALRLAVRPSPTLYARAALLDGVSGDPDDPRATHVSWNADEGFLVAVEAGTLLRPSAGAEVRAGPRSRRRRIGRDAPRDYLAKLALGAWLYTARSLALESAVGAAANQGRSRGLYLIGEARVAPERDASEEGLWAFLQIELADDAVNRFARYTGAGLVYRGLFRGRERDEAGLAIAAAHNGDAFLAAERSAGRDADRSELALELTYLLQLGKRFAAQPDLQYIINPGTDPAVENALAAGLRLEVTF